jgi:uncharacterized protein
MDIADKLNVIRICKDRKLLRMSSDHIHYTANPIGQQPPTEIAVWLHINNNCNLGCSYCFVEKDASVMTGETIAKVVTLLVSTIEKRSLKRIVIKFAGGEPTLCLDSLRDFCLRLETETRHLDVAIHYAILSNGTINTPALIEFILEKNVSFAVSLDGYGEAFHDIHRKYTGTQKGSWSRIQQNLDHLKKNGVRISINATISQESCASLPDLMTWLVDEAYPTRIGVVRPTRHKATGNVLLSAGVPDENYKDIILAFEKGFTRLEDPRISFDVANDLKICELHFSQPSYSVCCGAGTNHIVINHNGHLSSCPMTVSEQSIVEQEDAVSGARRTISGWQSEDRHLESGNCLECRWFPVCTSGCPVTNERIYGRPFVVSPMHPFYEYIVPRYIEFFGRKLVQSAQSEGLSAFVYTN